MNLNLDNICWDGLFPRMTAIRVGNVLGSEGRVAPLFLEQIARGGPLNDAQWVESPTLSDAHVAIGLAELGESMDEMNLAKLLTTLIRLVPEYQPSSYLQEQASIPAH